MPARLPFKLNRNGVLLALVSAAFASQAHAAAGRVDFATSGATVAGSDGRQRPLARGSELDKGDTIRTGEAGRAQIRFADGAYVSLQPNTEFAIKDYNFDGKADGSERGFFALARGAMRTVTGLIGRVNKNRYQISTPTATIGIRGTGGLIAIGADGSTLVTGSSGIWTITNPAGTIDVPAGTVGKAPATPSQPPQQTNDQISTGPSQPPVTTQPPFTEADNRNPNGTVTAIPQSLPPLTTGSGYVMAAAFQSNAIEGTTALTADNVSATFDSAGRFTDATTSASIGLGPFNPTLQPGGVQAEANNMDGLAWGRWTGPVQLCPTCSIDTYGPNNGFHYVIGTPTAVMPTNVDAGYVVMGATSPTYTSTGTSAGPGTFSGTLIAHFGSGSLTVDMNLDVVMRDAGRAYNVAGTTTPQSGPLFSGDASFSFGLGQTGQLRITPGTLNTDSTTCNCFCSANVKGFFAGKTAERAGLAYMIHDVSASGNGDIVGAAAFKKSP